MTTNEREGQEMDTKVRDAIVILIEAARHLRREAREMLHKYGDALERSASHMRGIATGHMIAVRVIRNSTTGCTNSEAWYRAIGIAVRS